ncbi:MAG: F0F1 ATP synthase subunit C [SAR86 cluster bacterium]|uniref:ATP synthase subunit c n=1 Tax=SAR86 cluster bacterium TaxID=2030880 RepID=A0A2A4MRN3_9GAMM|nr:MAG: F0F1 ATP synthase subunit C [SAR86 cluster bacterium]
METIQAFTLLAASIIFGLGGAGTAIGFGALGGKLIESSARQPELAPKLQTQFFLVAAFVDVIAIIGVGMAFFFIFANPFL